MDGNHPPGVQSIPGILWLPPRSCFIPGSLHPAANWTKGNTRPWLPGGRIGPVVLAGRTQALLPSAQGNHGGSNPSLRKPSGSNPSPCSTGSKPDPGQWAMLPARPGLDGAHWEQTGSKLGLTGATLSPSPPSLKSFSRAHKAP